MKSILLILFINAISIFSGFSQADPCHKTTEGKEFWFGFMESRWFQAERGTHHIEITITSLFDFNYSLFIGNVLFKSAKVLANTPEQIIIPFEMAESMGSEIIESKGIHLITDQYVNVFALNYSDSSSDVALIYPKNSLGKEYYAMCYSPYSSRNGVNYNSKNSEFLIVATEDNTTVYVTPSVVTDQGQSGTFQIKLNKGESYQVQSANLPGLPGQGDLTGSHITSNENIAFFSGNYSTSIPSGTCCYDHLYEQIPPLQAWGRKFITTPLKTRLFDFYRILAVDENQTTVLKGNTVLCKLNKGEMYEFSSDEAMVIESNNPILLAQLSGSRDNDRAFTGGDGDPFMIIVSPINQTRQKVAFVAYNSTLIKDKYFINITVKDEAIGAIMLDGQLRPSSDFISIKGSGYSYAQIKIQNGSHTIESTDPKNGFIADVYGFGGVESYGYGVGYSLDLVLDLGGETDEKGNKFLIRCGNADPVTLIASYGFDSYQWQTGETTQSIQANEEKTYIVTAKTFEGCSRTDSIKIMVSKPEVKLGNDTTICNPKTIILNANTNKLFRTFIWTTPSGDPITDQNIEVSKPGVYSVVSTTAYGCSSSDEIKVSFTDNPKLNLLNLETLICGKKSAILNISADEGSYTLERTDNHEQFKDLEVAVPQFGIYPFKFTATDDYGCASAATFEVGFHKIPTVSFSIDSTKCYHYNLSANYIGNATIDASRFTWVFGKDTIADGTGINSSIIPLGVNQTQRNLSLKVTEEGCSNADTIKDIKVIPDLEVRVADTLGCQPFNAEFTALNTEKVIYDWDYGDGITEQSNNHIFHTYQNDGYYNLKLKVTTEEGCTNSVTIDSVVYVAPIPTAGFTLDPSICLEYKDNQVSYSGTGDQNDTYNWDLSAFDPLEIIKHPGNTQGPFIFNLFNKPQAPLSLQVVSKFGCKSDISRILLKRNPFFSLNITGNQGCIPLEPGFSAVQKDLIDKISYTWDYGDGISGNGSETSHLYNEPNKHYNISVSGISEITGCSYAVSKDTLVFAYPKPVAKFSLNHSIVYNDMPDVQFENQSLGASHYLWDFGDGSTSDQINPANKFKGNGYKKVLLEAINDYQCSDTISQEVLVAFNRVFPPNAISPNAPNEIDRVFKLGHEAIKEEGYHLIIISRWNDVIFETKNEIKGWDGRTKNGDLAPPGSYVWVLDFVDFLNRKHQQKGTVTLIY